MRQAITLVIVSLAILVSSVAQSAERKPLKKLGAKLRASVCRSCR